MKQTSLFKTEAKRRPEWRDCIDSVQWLGLASRTLWKMTTHFPAGEIRDARVGAKLKAMGLLP